MKCQKRILNGRKKWAGQMFDTVVASVWILPRSKEEFENELIEGVSSKYRVEKRRIPFYSAVLNKHAYQVLLKFIHNESPEKYFLIKMNPRCDLIGIPELKIKTEISLFDNGDSFQDHLSSFNNSESFQYILANHFLSVLHVKCDFKKVLFDDLRISLDASSPRNPMLITNPDTGRRTLYVSSNHYYYEKPGCVRGELRINGCKTILKKLGISTLGQLSHVDSHRFLKLFETVSFKNPYRLTSRIERQYYEFYSYFLKCLNSTETHLVSGKRGNYLKSNNCFLCSKSIVAERTNKKFNSKILPYMKPGNVSFRPELLNEIRTFKGESYA